jgi:hypothetical protein
MNGQPVDEAEAVRSGARIELGRHGGPSFAIELAGEQPGSSLPVTDTHEIVEGAHSVAARARRSATAARGVAIVGVLLAVVAAGTVYYLSRSDSARLTEAVADLTEQQRRTAAQTISSEAQDKLIKGAYVCIIRFANGKVKPFGTATPIAPDLLGTNAHVVEVFMEKGADERIFVRAPGHDGALYEVVEVRKHPGYDALNDFVTKDPFYAVGTTDWVKDSNGYDVGTLRVAPGSNLSPVLELAGRDELEKLAPGFPLAMAGYPVEGIVQSQVQPLAPTPTLGVGIVTAMTDMFYVPTEFEHRILIRHNLPATGGASGSAIIGPSGRIVAFNNSGNVNVGGTGGRIPSAALINYGQRADMLADMLAGNGSALVDGQRAYWTKMTAGIKRGREYIIPIVLEALKPQDGMKAVPVSREDFVMTAADRTTVKNANGQQVVVRLQKRSLSVTAGRQYGLMGFADAFRGMNMYLLVRGKLVAQDEGRWLPRLGYAADQDGSVELVLLSPDADNKDVSYTLFQYVWSGSSS